jgi:hypothetical protein
MNNITQVNALIAKGSTGDAAAVSGALDEILKQLAVNRQHVDLFFSLYIKMLDRLFGEDVARAPEPVAANSAWTKGLPGGWLKALASVSQTADGGDSLKLPQPLSHPLGRNINATYLDSLPFPLSAILLKLSPTSPAFDVLSRIQGGCEIKLNLLPTKLQMFVADHPLYPYARARYHSYITSSLIRFPLNSANQVKERVARGGSVFLLLSLTFVPRITHQRNHVVHKNALLLDAIEYFFVCLLRYPTLSNAQVSTERTAATDNIYGRAYYPSTARSTPTEILQNRGISAWARGVPYLVLLQEYLREYVPVPVPADSGGTTTTSATPRKNDNQMVSEHEALQQQRYRELFLHLAVAYWLDSPLVLKTDHHKLGVLRRQLAGGAAGYSGTILLY